MVDFVRLSATAQRLIGANGRTVTLQNRTTTPVDVNKPWLGTTASGTSVSVTAVILDYDNDQVDGTLVQAGDRRALVADDDIDDFDISAGTTTLIDGSNTYSIESVMPIQPATKAVIYTLQLRGN